MLSFVEKSKLKFFRLKIATFAESYLFTKKVALRFVLLIGIDDAIAAILAVDPRISGNLKKS
jgi:hypothetical protein